MSLEPSNSQDIFFNSNHFDFAESHDARSIERLSVRERNPQNLDAHSANTGSHPPSSGVNQVIHSLSTHPSVSSYANPSNQISNSLSNSLSNSSSNSSSDSSSNSSSDSSSNSSYDDRSNISSNSLSEGSSNNSSNSLSNDSSNDSSSSSSNSFSDHLLDGSLSDLSDSPSDSSSTSTSGVSNSSSGVSNSSSGVSNSSSGVSNPSSGVSNGASGASNGGSNPLPNSTVQRLTQILLAEFQKELPAPSAAVRSVITRMVTEVERVCSKSDRIQSSGQVQNWQLTLARHRLKKCINYYQVGSRRGRVDLHTHLSTMVYRHIVASQAQMGFTARYGLIEDFMQSFYIEVLKAFRREHDLAENYSPRTKLELAEYMAFTEHYAKRRINLPGRRSQQLIVLRAQGFAHRQPPETTLDLELAVESAKSEDAEMQSRSSVMQQVREQMVSEAIDPSDSVVRDRIVNELVEYLESQGQTDCVDYLALKLQDLSAPEIDEILKLTPRERDYLQQRFKYHVEKFARSHRWQLVHQWLGADLDQNLGMRQQQWEAFLQMLTPDQRQLLHLKGQQLSDQEIGKALRCTAKQVHKRWVRLLEIAWQFRNSSPEVLGSAE